LAAQLLTDRRRKFTVQRLWLRVLYRSGEFAGRSPHAWCGSVSIQPAFRWRTTRERVSQERGNFLRENPERNTLPDSSNRQKTGGSFVDRFATQNLLGETKGDAGLIS
jgi:hypothetical protein